MTEQFQRLKETGFKPAGSWLLKGDCIAPDIHSFAEEKDALYAFIVKDEVKYVGKTSRLLKERLGMYRKPGKTQRTNIRNNAHIKRILSAGDDVLIYALINDNKEFKGFKLSLPAALEDSIIEVIKPEWNVRK